MVRHYILACSGEDRPAGDKDVQEVSKVGTEQGQRPVVRAQGFRCGECRGEARVFARRKGRWSGGSCLHTGLNPSFSRLFALIGKTREEQMSEKIHIEVVDRRSFLLGASAAAAFPPSFLSSLTGSAAHSSFAAAPAISGNRRGAVATR